jgi:hypothetical protein
LSGVILGKGRSYEYKKIEAFHPDRVRVGNNTNNSRLYHWQTTSCLTYQASTCGQPSAGKSYRTACHTHHFANTYQRTNPNAAAGQANALAHAIHGAIDGVIREQWAGDEIGLVAGWHLVGGRERKF